jgi:hypothetical protein
MKIWKFVLLGITGDLAESKILPALAEFAFTYRKEVDIHVVGWSRSEANSERIHTLLEWNGESYISHVSFIREEYSSHEVVQQLVNTQNNEEIIVYSAIPPVVFGEMMASFCPFPEANLHILMEKPFGQSSKEARVLIEQISSCTLETKVHFLDHFAFKPALRLSNNETQNFGFLSAKDITQIEISAVEQDGVGNRLGYYQSIGALKDMTNHLLVALEQVLKLHKKQRGPKWPIRWTDLRLGQYQDFIHELGKESSIETKFELQGILHLDSEIQLKLLSGKKMYAKQTVIQVMYADQSKVVWRVSPDPVLSYDGYETIAINISKGPQHDHVNVFADVLNENFSYFRTTEQVLADWQAYDEAAGLKGDIEIY